MKSQTKPHKSPRILGKSRAGNRRLFAALEPPPEPGWPATDSPIDSPDRDGECAGCESLQLDVSALKVEMETLLGTMRQYGEMLADLNERVGRGAVALRLPSFLSPHSVDTD